MKTALIAALGGLLLASGAAQADMKKCRCVANGTSYEQGQVVCLMIGSMAFTARCDRFLNNTTWTRLGEGCDVSSAAQPNDTAEPANVEVAGLPEVQ